MISATGLELRAGSRILLSDATLRVQPGDRIGLVGRNGAGKTTTLRVLAGEGEPYAGDLSRRGELQKLTRDHTLAQKMADQGRISARDAASHRLRHVLTQAIGIQETGVDPDIRRLQLTDGDRLLLCTDGLTRHVPDERIAGVLGRAADAESACRELVNDALEGGGSDNVTVVVARMQG